MTGPEHYREAERLIAAVTMDSTHPDGSPVIRSDEPETIALAQVHATLALAASTAVMAIATGETTVDETRAWDDVTSGGPS